MIYSKDNQQVKLEQQEVLKEGFTLEYLRKTKYFVMHLNEDKWFDFIQEYHLLTFKELAIKFNITENAARTMQKEQRAFYRNNIPTGYELIQLGNNNKYYLNRDGFLLDRTNRFVSVSYEHQKYYHRYKATIYFDDLSDPRKQHFAHRLLAITFIPNKYGYEQVNHKNGIHNDNRIENLEWVTNAENMKHSIKELTTRIDLVQGEKNPRHILSDDKVIMYRNLYINNHINTTGIALVENMSASAVISMLKGTNWSHLPDYIEDVKKKMKIKGLSSEVIESIAELETVWQEVSRVGSSDPKRSGTFSLKENSNG